MKNNNILKSPASVGQFYAGKSIFITGGTGFLGKALVEKLLRSCKELDKVYILIRAKRNVTVEKRIDNLKKEILFDRLRNENPDALNKMVPVCGDLSVPNLIECDERLAEVIQNVSVVFHIAASIKFNEPLNSALRNNVEGTQKVLNLCRQIKKLTAFVHVSTAYCNCDQKVVEEIVYPPPASLDEVYALAKIYGDSLEDSMKIIKGKPNIYTYTKALAETEVLKAHSDIPAAIIRPSIVTPAWKEPVAGWLDNWFGATGLVYGISKGHLRFLKGRTENVLDFIPVDIVTNMTIIAATKCNRSDLKVYNCCSGSRNPVNLSEIGNYSASVSAINEWNDIPWPKVTIINSSSLVYLLQLLFHWMPAYCFDVWRRMTGQKPKYLDVMKKYSVTIEALNYFIVNNWKFEDKNARQLIESISLSDKEEFYCDPTYINWKSYMTDYLKGVNRILLKTPVQCSVR